MQKSPRYIFIHNVPRTAATIPLKKKTKQKKNVHKYYTKLDKMSKMYISIYICLFILILQVKSGTLP